MAVYGLNGRPGAEFTELLDAAAARLAHTLQTSCRVETEAFDASETFDESRGQYHSTAILQAMQAYRVPADRVLLGVTEEDLFVPILTFVFGEAQISGPLALVSTARLRDEYYGMPQNPPLLLERTEKEALHEIGHTQGLRHCSDWNCVMSSSHAVERIDLKAASYCLECWKAIAGR